jgi:single-stranded DNA-binding protein
MQYRTYDDKNGVKHNVAEIVANNLIMLDGKPRQPAQPGDEGAPPRSADEGDLPF